MQRWLTKVLLFIAVITMLTGVGQIFAAPIFLNIIGATSDKTSAHFFAIIGMFMFLFGALLMQTLRSREKNAIAVFWCGMQKIGAAVAISLGVYHAVFSKLAISVAAFDLLSGILIFLYWSKRKGGGH